MVLILLWCVKISSNNFRFTNEKSNFLNLVQAYYSADLIPLACRHIAFFYSHYKWAYLFVCFNFSFFQFFLFKRNYSNSKLTFGTSAHIIINLMGKQKPVEWITLWHLASSFVATSFGLAVRSFIYFSDVAILFKVFHFILRIRQKIYIHTNKTRAFQLENHISTKNVCAHNNTNRPSNNESLWHAYSTIQLEANGK